MTVFFQRDADVVTTQATPGVPAGWRGVVLAVSYHEVLVRFGARKVWTPKTALAFACVGCNEPVRADGDFCPECFAFYASNKVCNAGGSQ